MGLFSFTDLPLTVYGWGYQGETSPHAPLAGVHRTKNDRFTLLCGYTKMDGDATMAPVDEAALAEAVAQDRIGGVGIDVYSVEPMPKEHPFYPLRERENVCLTPHMAWGAYEARARCLSEIVENIHAFVRGERRCRVD